MIFYTLKGPSHSLEIHDDKIHLKKKIWFRLFSSRPAYRVWKLEGLSEFNITIPPYVLWGKVEWKAFDGTSGTFRFSTNPLMMKKIELYLQKKIVKNHQNLLVVTRSTKRSRRKAA